MEGDRGGHTGTYIENLILQTTLNTWSQSQSFRGSIRALLCPISVPSRARRYYRGASPQLRGLGRFSVKERVKVSKWSSNDFDPRLRGFDAAATVHLVSHHAVHLATHSRTPPSACFLFSQLFWRSLTLHPRTSECHVGGEGKRGWNGVEWNTLSLSRWEQ